VGLAGWVFAGQEADAQEHIEVLLDESLERLLQGNRPAFEFANCASTGTEDLDVAHEGLLGVMDSARTEVGSQRPN
jgi:hypothetical protein